MCDTYRRHQNGDWKEPDNDEFSNHICLYIYFIMMMNHPSSLLLYLEKKNIYHSREEDVFGKKLEVSQWLFMTKHFCPE